MRSSSASFSDFLEQQRVECRLAVLGFAQRLIVLDPFGRGQLSCFDLLFRVRDKSARALLILCTLPRAV